MTAIAPATGRPGQQGQAGRASDRVPWRRLAWVTWRQHRAALTGMLAVFALAAVLTAVTGLQLHATAPRSGPGPLASRWWRSFDVETFGLMLAYQAIPVIAGMFLGAPLIAREAENGTGRLVWTQEASRTRLLVAKVVPIAVLLAVAAASLGRELSWLQGQFRTGIVVSPWGYPSAVSWGPLVFDLHPLPFAGWVTLGFSLGVFLGALIRRTVPAMAATLACYAALGYAAISWRTAYLAPLRRPVSVQFSAGGGYSYGAYWGSQHGPGPDALRSNLGWPDGRLISDAQVTHHSAAWLTRHQIQLWVTYQPGSRYGLFQLIEFGWLIALSVILIAATVVMIARRAA